MAQLLCEGVSLGYEGEAIVRGLDFRVEEGDYLCILGENGSGKSTLIKTLLGLVPPLEGRVTPGDGLMMTEIGYLPQQTPVQRDFPASVEEIVLSGCLNGMGLRPFYGKKEKTLARANMERLEIGHLAKKCYRELSGGQQQRVLLARALCATKKMLLLDEPVAGLDPKATQEMYELVARLNKEGVTVLMVSHDIPAAVRWASHILHVGKRPLFFGTRQDYLASDVGRMSLAMAKGENDA